MKSKFENNEGRGDATVEKIINQLMGEVIQKQQADANNEQEEEQSKEQENPYFELDAATKEKIDSILKELKTICGDNGIPLLAMYQIRNSEESYGMHRAAVRAGKREVTEFHLIHELVEIMFDSASADKSRFVKEGLVILLMLSHGR